MTKSSRLTLLFLILFMSIIKAQTEKTDPLYTTIMAKDSLFFSAGYNTCNIQQMESLLSDKFEFYHDKGGFEDRKNFIIDFKNGLCKSPETYQIKRVLVDKSTEIYPMYKNGKIYAAIQNGNHLFYEKMGNHAEKLVGEAKFTHLWMLENAEWKLRNSLSFNHHPKQTTDSETMFDNDQSMQSWLKENDIPALGLGIIEDGKLKQVKVFGEIKKGIPAPPNALFNVASLTKPVTAMVVLRLVSLGKWQLDEPLDTYWIDPDISNDPKHKKLTTRIILTHQTGFPNWRWMNTDKKLNFQFDPGTRYQYSGEGFEYLRKAMEKKFGKTLEQLAQELIFQPLKMKDSSYIWDKSTDESRFAIGYDKDGKAYPIEKNKTANAADDLHTTITDYGNFMVSVMKGQKMEPKVFQEMIRKQVKTKENKYFGLGFEIYDLGNGDYALSHSGADRGTQCIAIVLPDSGKGIVIFTNVDDGYKVYEKLVLHYLGKQGKKIVDIETR
ncbi:CubicO group peptidase (beta-lactamase class C family) [Chryseobacterium bernardetii]|uniref:CubicO group peptidase (Beta-lactamase class C family) n=2 Tax=Chryseobacterium TaxID=59732 RepID=A0A543ELP8_9FLAO|nr:MULTISPECIES: serine hydrolase [Chryseobacterium]MDR6368895.1 CubicO group peptidase (beta-lactamase class C family) [Chryseobacterium vietnamense]MDR6440182.1 CubicO group peptidase (beta-lactamase class C family) [Chryseobacterium bernardetii]TQM22506.1 CubicO group peptidase (beta-lactamase class C family) [Chryseobacterium aquifrigidense]